MDLATINPDEVDKELDQHAFLVIHDPEVARLAIDARAEYDRSLKASKVHPPREKFHYSALAKGPWRKLAIGSSNGIGDPYAQNLQTIYYDANDADYPALGALFKIMNVVRNKLMRVAPGFGDNPEQDKFWNACRVHHYPRGGGFMVMHKDTHFTSVVADQLGKPFYQLCVLLSRKNEDFKTGGGVIVNNQNEKIDLETAAGFGSLVIFDGRTWHGVEDVDLDQVIDFSRSDGRLAAFANLYSA